MKRLIHILLVLLIISTACKKEHNVDVIEVTEKPFPLKFIKEKEVKIDALGYPNLFSLKNSKNIMVRLEKRDTVILTYDAGLNLVKTDIIKYGEGPNECLLPIVMGADENHIIVLDLVTKRYYMYDTDFKTRTKLHAEPRGWIPHGFNFSYKHNTILSCIKPFNPSLGKFDEYCVFLRRLVGDRVIYQDVFTMRSPGYIQNYIYICGRPIYSKMIDDHIYILKKKEYELIKMNIEGRVLKKIRVTGLEKKFFTRRERGDWIEAVGLDFNRSEYTLPEELWPANGILDLAGGIAVIRIKDYKPREKEWLDADYFDYKLNFLGKIKIPGFPMWNYPAQIQSGLFFFSKGDILYFIDVRETEIDEEYWLTRWKIEK